MEAVDEFADFPRHRSNDWNDFRDDWVGRRHLPDPHPGVWLRHGPEERARDVACDAFVADWRPGFLEILQCRPRRPAAGCIASSGFFYRWLFRRLSSAVGN